MTIEDLVLMGEKKLMDLFNAAKGKILIVDSEKKSMFSVNGETKQRVYHSMNVGIAGSTFATGETMNVVNAYNNHHFNSEIDVDTSMPIISMPIRKDKVREHTYLRS